MYQIDKGLDPFGASRLCHQRCWLQTLVLLESWQQDIKVLQAVVSRSKVSEEKYPRDALF
jgi:hypothetical protein